MTRKCSVCSKVFKSKEASDMCTDCLRKMIFNQFYGVGENPAPEESEIDIEPEVDYDLSDIRDTFKAKENEKIYKAVREADALGISYGEYMALRREKHGNNGRRRKGT